MGWTVRIDPRTNLTLRLIESSSFGPGRFEPLRAHEGNCTADLPKGRPCPAESDSTPDGRSTVQPTESIEPWAALAKLESGQPAAHHRACPPVRQVIVQPQYIEVLPAHLVGSLLDTLA